MADQTRQAILAAVALAVLTLGTFFQFRDFGPQSTIRRWHEAVAVKDLDTINNLTVGGWANPNTQGLANLIFNFLRAGAKYDIVAIRKPQSKVVVAVEYRFGNGMSRPLVWYLQKEDDTWKVNAEDTATSLSRQLGLSR